MLYDSQVNLAFVRCMSVAARYLDLCLLMRNSKTLGCFDRSTDSLLKMRKYFCERENLRINFCMMRSGLKYFHTFTKTFDYG